jgi:hypothetical protein
VLEYHSIKQPTNTHTALVTSYDSRPPVTESAAHWHAALGHPDPETIAYLKSTVNGVIVDSKTPAITEYETCALLKAYKIVSRRSNKKNSAAEPLARVIYDLIPLTLVYNSNK